MIQRDIQRWKLLKGIYDVSGGRKDKPVEVFDIASKNGIDRNAVTEIVQYLKDEWLINDLGYGEASLAQLGLKEVEQVMRSPSMATNHFPANISTAGLHEEQPRKTVDSTATVPFTVSRLN